MGVLAFLNGNSTRQIWYGCLFRISC